MQARATLIVKNIALNLNSTTLNSDDNSVDTPISVTINTETSNRKDGSGPDDDEVFKND